MAVSKSIQSTALLIEVSSGINNKGELQFKKNSFSNVMPDAKPENVYNVAKALCEILSGETRRVYLRDTSIIVPISEPES